MEPAWSTCRIPCTAASAVIPPPTIRYLYSGMPISIREHRADIGLIQEICFYAAHGEIFAGQLESRLIRSVRFFISACLNIQQSYIEPADLSCHLLPDTERDFISLHDTFARRVDLHQPDAARKKWEQIPSHIKSGRSVARCFGKFEDAGIFQEKGPFLRKKQLESR